jgi:hypothetical protein
MDKSPLASMQHASIRAFFDGRPKNGTVMNGKAEYRFKKKKLIIAL